MTAQPKKKFPGIFITIAVSFLIYLAVVSVMIYVHYVKRASDKPQAQTASAQTVN